MLQIINHNKIYTIKINATNDAINILQIILDYIDNYYDKADRYDELVMKEKENELLLKENDKIQEKINILNDKIKSASEDDTAINMFKELQNEIKIRDASGKIKNVSNVNIRMADGTIKSLPPGKSSSSGGGGLEEAKSPAWQRKEGKDPSGGLNQKGIDSYRAQNPGSKLQKAVTTKPSKLKPGSKKAKRRLSFCRRMKGLKSKLTSAKTARDPDSRVNKSFLKVEDCFESLVVRLTVSSYGAEEIVKYLLFPLPSGISFSIL